MKENRLAKNLFFFSKFSYTILFQENWNVYKEYHKDERFSKKIILCWKITGEIRKIYKYFYLTKNICKTHNIFAKIFMKMKTFMKMLPKCKLFWDFLLWYCMYFCKNYHENKYLANEIIKKYLMGYLIENLN